MRASFHTYLESNKKGLLFIAIIAVALAISTIYLVLDKHEFDTEAGATLNQPMSLFSLRLASLSANSSTLSVNRSSGTSVEEKREERSVEALRSAIAAPSYVEEWVEEDDKDSPYSKDLKKPLFTDITAIATDGTRYLYLADNGAATITKTDNKGNVVARWGGFGTQEGQFRNIVGIAVDPYGYVYVADVGNLRIQKFDSYGRFMLMWGKRGTGKGEFMSMSGIAAQYNIDARGTLIFVTDQAASRVLIFSTDGEYVGVWGEYGLIRPAQVDHSTVSGVMDRISLSGSYVPVVPAENPSPEIAERNIAFLFKGVEHTITVNVDRGAYLGTKYNTPTIGTDTFPEPELWSEYYFKMYADPVNEPIFDSVLSSLQQIQRRENLSVREVIELAISFVQQIPLSTDATVRYPIEVIHDKKGNSFDKALFLYGIFERLGVNAAYLYFPQNKESAIGLGKNSLTPATALAEFGPDNQYKYIYVDVTEPRAIGDMPNKLKNDDPFLLRENWDNIDELQGYDFNTADEVLYTYEFLKNRLEYINKAKNTAELRGKLDWSGMGDKISEVLKVIEENPLNYDKIVIRIKNSKVREMTVRVKDDDR
ncbi:MAG: hypothetical protein LBV40_03040 [Methanomicrobiales archaeon]|jgi:hypothetical protein|nr:hypothetical protein [Methanomicrobiales archaeon]